MLFRDAPGTGAVARTGSGAGGPWGGGRGGAATVDVPAVAVIAMVAIATGFAVWQAVYRSEQVIVVSDPGVYLQYGYWIAVHGSARIPASAAAFGAVPGLNFGSTGFSRRRDDHARVHAGAAAGARGRHVARGAAAGRC